VAKFGAGGARAGQEHFMDACQFMA
jgi:hypothetical protein